MSTSYHLFYLLFYGSTIAGEVYVVLKKTERQSVDDGGLHGPKFLGPARPGLQFHYQ